MVIDVFCCKESIFFFNLLKENVRVVLIVYFFNCKYGVCFVCICMYLVYCISMYGYKFCF